MRKCKNPEKCWQLRLGYVQWALEVRPWGLHYCESIIITIQILLIFKAGVKDASCIQYIMNRQEQFCVEKRPVELKCQIDLKTIIFAGIRHGDHQELGSHSLGVSSVASPGISWQYLLYSKLSFNSFLAHSDCYDLISHQWRSVWLWLQWSELHPTTSPMTRTRQLWIARHTNAI